MDNDKVIEMIIAGFNDFKKELSENVRKQIKDLKKDFHDKFVIFEEKVTKMYIDLHDSESRIRDNSNDISHIKKDVVEAFRKIRNMNESQILHEKQEYEEKIELVNEEKDKIEKSAPITARQKLIFGTVVFGVGGIFTAVVSIIARNF